MQVDKTLAFDFNCLSLPRLLQEEVEVDLNRIPMRETLDGDVLVRFADLYDLSSRLGIGIHEAFELLKEDHAIKQPMYAVVLEERFYEDYPYQRAVLEEGWDIPILVKSAGTDKQLDEVLMECVEDGLYYGNTEKLESLCELFGNLFGLSNGNAGVEANSIGATIDNVKQNVGNWIHDKVSGGLRNLGGHLMNGAVEQGKKWMDNPEIQEKVGQFAQKTAGTIAGKGAEGIRQAVWPYVRNFLLGAGAAGVAGIASNQLNNMTNQENQDTNNPGTIARMMNSMKSMLGSLNQQQQAAAGNPQQQGLIRRMIEKIKNSIRALGRKVGLTQ